MGFIQSTWEVADMHSDRGSWAQSVLLTCVLCRLFPVAPDPGTKSGTGRAGLHSHWLMGSLNVRSEGNKAGQRLLPGLTKGQPAVTELLCDWEGP